ncbi:MAG: 30S ribosomal protein S20, partial [Acidobacteria bacterium]|nr:30S ribosomal protein S20 [Acidobacteriota bacterium]
AIDAGDMAKAKTALSATFSLIDKMAGKGIIHRNAAGRYKSRLAKRTAK